MLNHKNIKKLDMPLNCGLMHYLEISFVPKISTAKQLHGRNWVLDYLEILLKRAVSPLEVKLGFTKFAIYSSCNMFKYVIFPTSAKLSLSTNSYGSMHPLFPRQIHNRRSDKDPGLL